MRRLYRSFTDGIGANAGAASVEGDCLELTLIRFYKTIKTLTIKVAGRWNGIVCIIFMTTPDIKGDFKKAGNADAYIIVPHLSKEMNLKNYWLEQKHFGIKKVYT